MITRLRPVSFFVIFSILIGMPFSALSIEKNRLDISVENVYVRTVPPGQPNTGVFMTLNNGTDAVQSIVNAQSNVAKVVELHTHVHEDGMMKMRRIEKIDIPANGQTVLKPGGLHIMLIGLNQEVIEGEPVEVILEFDNGETKIVQAVGRKLKMKMKHQQSSPMMHKNNN